MHLLSLKNTFRARLPSKLNRQLIHQHHLQSHLHCGNDPTVANHNEILSTAHGRNTVETPFTMRNRSETDPTMIRPHTRPSRTRRTAKVDHRRSGTHFVWKNIEFRAFASHFHHVLFCLVFVVLVLFGLSLVLLLLSLLSGPLFYGIVTAINLYRFPSRTTFALAMTELYALIHIRNSVPCSLQHAIERVERPGES